MYVPPLYEYMIPGYTLRIYVSLECIVSYIGFTVINSVITFCIANVAVWRR